MTVGSLIYECWIELGAVVGVGPISNASLSQGRKGAIGDKEGL